MWYFCEKSLVPHGWSAVNEMVCLRLAEKDPRFGAWSRDWQKKGWIFGGGDPIGDPESEMLYLSSKVRYERISKITVKDAPKT